MSRVLDAALNAIWAMEESALENLLTIAAREHNPTPEALEAYRAAAMKNAERARVREGVAIVSANGPMFKRANLMTELSGATSYETLMRDFRAAVDDSKIKAILLDVDSPGGEALGVAELAQSVYDARGAKPIVAYVGGMGASAGYWLASAAERIVVDETALLGSIGVQMSMTDTSKAEEKRGVKTYRFVSSQSPHKNAGPETEEGEKSIRTMIDSMAQVFVDTVARNRGVDTETVLKDFGQGGIFVGKDAVQAGLADAVGSFESVLADLAASSGSRSTRSKGTRMSETSEPAATAQAETVDVAKVAADAAAAAVQADRARVSGLQTIAAAHGVDAATLNAAIAAGTDVGAFALSVAEATAKKASEAAAAEAAAGTAAVTALKKDEQTAAAVEPEAPAEDADTVEAIAARIAAA